MTLHDKLKEIIDRHNYKLCMLPGSPDQETISAIIQAVAERLPGVQKLNYAQMVEKNDIPFAAGWNAYRDEVRKVLGEIPDFTKGGHTTGPYSIDSST